MVRLSASIIEMELEKMLGKMIQNTVGVKSLIQNRKKYKNSVCGGWVLLEIKGEPTADDVKLLGVDDQITFGKYKGKTIREVIDEDWQYIRWAVIDSQRLLADVDKIVEYHESKVKPIEPNDIITFGKYKGRTLLEIFTEDPQYLRWLQTNNPDFKVNWDKLNESIG